MFGVMIGMLFGNEDSDKVFQAARGKAIAALVLSEEQLLFTFTDGTKMKLFDDGQAHLESRYMHSDDNLQFFVGSKLLDVEVRDVPDIETGPGVHEVQFLVVTTSAGVFTVETHCVHTGYYGGFTLRAIIPEVVEGRLFFVGEGKFPYSVVYLDELEKVKQQAIVAKGDYHEVEGMTYLAHMAVWEATVLGLDGSDACAEHRDEAEKGVYVHSCSRD